MKYRKDRCGNELSQLGYGCMRFSRKGSQIDYEKAEREVLYAIEKGVNYFDTAYAYGGSEECLGRILEENGMFYQVIDHPEAEGNYLETSGSALIAYAFLKGARLGYLPERFAEAGEKIFYGITEKYLTKKPDGTPGLGGICLVAGLGGNTHRDGSLEYYFSEPVVEDEAKGIAPLIMAYVELLQRR